MGLVEGVILVFITLGALSLMIGSFLSQILYGFVFASPLFPLGVILMFFFWIIAGLIHVTGPMNHRSWK